MFRLFFFVCVRVCVCGWGGGGEEEEFLFLLSSHPLLLSYLLINNKNTIKLQN